MLEFFYNIIIWTPWVSFFTECAFLQLGILISIFFFHQAKSLFYSLVYMFIIFIWLGLFLSYYNLEFLTGFLWAAELTVIFIILLFLFFFNFGGDLKNLNFFFLKFIIVIFFFFFDDFSFRISFLNFNFFFDDFYESRLFSCLNDIHALFLNYYIFNSFLLFLFGFLLFLVSISCISLLKASRFLVTSSAVSSMKIYNFFRDLLSFEFLRKQNLFFQNLRRPTSRLVKKNLQEWYKKNQD
jgi:hypothetical protein